MPTDDREAFLSHALSCSVCPTGLLCDEGGELHDSAVQSEVDACIRDDSTECDCSRCVGNEDAFWRVQEGDSWPLVDEPVYGGEAG